MRAVVLSVAFVLAGCTTASSPAPAGPTRAQCLPLVSYSPAQQEAVAKALEALPKDSPIHVMIADYGAMRAADRACLGLSK